VAHLVEHLQGKVAGLGFLIELKALKGRERISQYDIHTVLKY
jgi:adenine phosphoribosyltransferase